MAKKSKAQFATPAGDAEIEVVTKPGLGLEEGLVLTTTFLLALAIALVVTATNAYWRNPRTGERFAANHPHRARRRAGRVVSREAAQRSRWSVRRSRKNPLRPERASLPCELPAVWSTAAGLLVMVFPAPSGGAPEGHACSNRSSG